VSPAASGVWPSLVIWSPLSAAVTCPPPKSTPAAAAASATVAACTAWGWLWPSGPEASTPKHWTVSGLVPGRSVVIGLVDVDHRFQRGVERGQHGVVPERGLVQPGHGALLEQEGRPEAVGLDETFGRGGELGAVGGGQRLRVPAGHRQPHVGALVHRAQHPPDEGGMQERHVGGADEGHVRLVSEGGQAGGQALDRPLALPRVVHQLDVFRQRRQLLAVGADHHDRAAGGPGQDADRAAQQRRPVPLQGRLGRAHP